MKASWYAEALYGAISGKSKNDSKKIFARFREVLAMRGHGALLRFIPHELEKIAENRKAHNEITLVTADSKSHAKWVHAYDHYEKEGVIPKGAIRRDVVDDSIIGGFQIRTRDMLIDGSYKKPLIELYRSIIN
ncbi:MAG: F0F1 ATP synthase subunit delta [Candidatus Yonathbacteria bacterium]|nr:F0F1 ATP synthase subunit delta [Candidatus Yonathbacteria bacterium]